MRVTFPPSTVCTTTVQLHLQPARDSPAGKTGAGQHMLTLGDQLERLVADVLEHAVEAIEVAARALVPVVAVRLRGHLRRDHDHDLLVQHLERRLHPAARVQLEQPAHDLDVRVVHGAHDRALG